MFSFLKASAPKPRIDSSRTDAEYKNFDGKYSQECLLDMQHTI